MSRSATGQRWRDGLALVVVLADLATYVALLHQGSAGVGFIKDPRAMASIVLISTVLLCPMSSDYGRAGNLWTTFIGLLGAATLGVGIATLATDGWGVLAALMIGLGLMWVLSATHHLLQSAPAAGPARTRAAAKADGEHGTASVLVAYASRHGFTEGIADRLAATLRASGRTVDERPVASVHDLAGYDAFVIGSAAYMGQWLRPATRFVLRNRKTLVSHPVWLFSSGPLGTSATDAKGRDVLETTAPKQFAQFRTLLRPRDLRVFFGGLDARRMGRTTRLMRAAPAAREAMPEGDFRDWPAIDAWAEEIARELAATPVASS
ncbi:MAG: flavodoxin domain-containing protein [Candidatus Dormibacteria bacterium]